MMDETEKKAFEILGVEPQESSSRVERELEERSKQEAAKLEEEGRKRLEYAKLYAIMHRPGNRLTLERSGTDYVVGAHGEWLRERAVRGKAARKRLKRLRRDERSRSLDLVKEIFED